MLVMRTTKSPAYPVGQFIRTEQPIELHDPPFAVNPLGLYSVQPRTLFRQKATDDPHPTAAVLDSSIVFAEPPANLLGDVPGSVVPDEQKELSCRAFRAPPSTTRETAWLWSLRAFRRRTLSTCRPAAEGRARSRRRLSARGRPLRPTVGSSEVGSPPRRSGSKWAKPPGSTSIRPRNRWPIRDRLRPLPSVGR